MDHRLIILIRTAVANGRLKPEHAPHWEGLVRGLASKQKDNSYQYDQGAQFEQLIAELEQTERHALDRDPLEILGLVPESYERVVKSVQVEIHVSQKAFAFKHGAVKARTVVHIVKEPGCKDLRVKAKGTAHGGLITVGHISSKSKGGIAKALEHDLLFWKKPYRATAVTDFGGGGKAATPPTQKALINIDFEPPHYLVWPEGACKECHKSDCYMFEYTTRSMPAGAEKVLPPRATLADHDGSTASYFSDDDGDGVPTSFESALLLELEQGGRVAKNHDTFAGAGASGGDEAPMTRALTARDFRTAEIMANDALARITINEKSKRKPFSNSGKPTNEKTRRFVAFAEAGGGAGAGVVADHPLDEVLSRKAVCKMVNASAGSSPLASKFEDGHVTTLVKQFLHYTDPQKAKKAAEDVAKRAMWESGHAVEDAELAVEKAEATADAGVTQLCLHGCGQPTYHPNSQTCNRNGTCSEMYS